MKIVEDENHKKAVLDLATDERDIWAREKLIKLNATCLGVSAFSGMVGMGGGFFYIPFFWGIGFGKKVTNATCLFIVFWSKLASTV